MALYVHSISKVATKWTASYVLKHGTNSDSKWGNDIASDNSNRNGIEKKEKEKQNVLEKLWGDYILNSELSPHINLHTSAHSSNHF